MEPMRRLPLEGASNVRDLGGYWTESGRVTQFQRFLRSDNTAALTAEDVARLREYGVTTVIDLRSAMECQHEPDVWPQVAGVQYKNISFIKDQVDDAMKVDTTKISFDLGDFYIALLESKDLVYEIMHTMAEADDGVILYHCTGGKDRVGVISMLLLLLAGVSPVDIVADYQVSFTYLSEKETLMAAADGKIDKSVLYSQPETIQRSLAHIAQKYGVVDIYLQSCGLHTDDLKKLRQRLLGV